MQILRIIAAIASIIFGIVAIVQPTTVANSAGLPTATARAKAEIRINWGGLFIALGLGVIILNAVAAYQLFGLGYVGLAGVRTVEALRDRSIVDRAYIITVVFEIISAIIFLVPA